MKIRALALVALAVLLPLSATACGTSDSGSGSGGAKTEIPALKNLSKRLQQGGMSKAQADCVAKAFDDSKISEADVAKLQKGDVTGLDAATLRRYSKSIASCISTITTGTKPAG